jgi:hypothetical protein
MLHVCHVKLTNNALWNELPSKRDPWGSFTCYALRHDPASGNADRVPREQLSRIVQLYNWARLIRA